MNKKQLLFALVIVVIAAFATAVVIYLAISQPDELHVGYMRITAHLPVIVADKNKIFRRNQLDVKLEQFSDTPSLMKALEIGRIDVAYQVTPDSAWHSAAEGNKYFVYFIARSTSKSPIDGLYAMGDISSDDLKNKIVGHFPGPTAAAMTGKILEKEYGLKPEDYELRPVSPPLQQAQLKSGEIVALFTYEPIGTLLVDPGRVGAKRVLSGPVEKHVVDPWNGGVGLFSEDLVVRRRSVATSFLAAIKESVDVIQADQELMAEAMVDLMPGMDRATAKKVPLTEYFFVGDRRKNRELQESLDNQLLIYQSLGILKGEGGHNLQVFEQ